MRYILHCLLHGPVVSYQTALIDAIAERFDLRWTQRQALAPHFTVKYWFETEHIAEVESLLERFSATRGETPVIVGGISSFPRDIIFLGVNLSAEARETFRALVGDLQTLPWMQWDEYDGDRLHFHATIAERCGSHYSEILDFLAEKEQYFQCSFDNVAILRNTGIRDGIDEWAIHRTYQLRGEV
jgi:2'-5' RNA ligase